MTTKTLSHNDIIKAIEEDSQAEIIIEQLELNAKESEFVLHFDFAWDRDTNEFTHVYIDVNPWDDSMHLGNGSIHKGWIETEKALHKDIEQFKQEGKGVTVYGVDGCIKQMQRQLPKAKAA